MESVVVSIRRVVADAFGLTARTNISITRVVEDRALLEGVELVFKEQYVSRGDMWTIGNKLRHNVLYAGQNISCNGMRVQVSSLNGTGGGNVRGEVRCGVVSPHTRLVFRSRSARITWLVSASFTGAPAEC